MKRIPSPNCFRYLVPLCLCLGVTGCVPAPGASPSPSQVQNGQLYQSGQSEFDAVFRELHSLQQQLADAPAREREIRKSLARTLAVEDGATRQVLAERVSSKATELRARKILIRLETQGLDADDPDDTMAQARLAGELDDESQHFVEAAALATRQELRFAARLRRAQKRIEHLAHHSAALEPWIEATFGRQGATKVLDVRRNLVDARRQFPLLTVRASSLADEARLTAQKLAHALTTDADIGSSSEPPLIAPVESTPPTPKHQRPSGRRHPTKKAASGGSPPTKKPVEPSGADFEP